jgi:hypothetical protein
MIRWQCNSPEHRGGAMPEFTTVSVKEAKLRRIPGRQGSYINEYTAYITQLPKGQAGRLRIGESEKHATVRRRLGVAAKALNIPLTIKRSGTDVYFWKEDKGNEQPRAKRSYTRRAIGREETTEPDQPFSVSEEVDHEATLEEFPE